MLMKDKERNRDPGKRTVRDRMHELMEHHGRKVAVAIAAVFALLLILTTMESTYAFQEMHNAYTDLTSELSASKTDLEEARQELQASVDETEALLDATTEDQVDDPAVLSDTAENLAAARTHLSTKPADAEKQPHWLMEIPGLRDAVDENATTAETMRTSLADSEGQVQDESTREALSAAIHNAESLLTDKSADDLAAYQSVTDELNTAKASVDKSIAAKKAAEEAARKAEEERKGCQRHGHVARDLLQRLRDGGG